MTRKTLSLQLCERIAQFFWEKRGLVSDSASRNEID